MSIAEIHLADQGPLDTARRVLHAEDPAAQLALSLANLESALAEAGLSPRDLTRVEIRTPAPHLVRDVEDVLTERFRATGAAPDVTLTEVESLPDRDMLVVLAATARRTTAKLLVVVAHPDDEAFGCGSVLAHAQARGASSVVVCATRGELGEPAPGSGLSRAELPAVRERELREACALLGAERVEVLGYLDSGVSGEPAAGSLAAADPDELRDRVAAAIERHRPDVVVTLDASDGHRDHAAVRDATLAAIEVVPHRPARTYLFCLARSLMTEFTGVPLLGTPDADLTTVVDVAHLLDLRERAIRTHASQVPPFDSMGRRLRHQFLAVDRLLRVDPPWEGGPLETCWLPPHPTDTPTTTTEGRSMSTIPDLSPAATLRGLCDGRVHLPGDPGYDAARTPWNVSVDQRPAAVAVPHTAEEVQEVVRAAAAAGLRVAPQSTGHAAAPLGERGLADTVLVRLSELTGVTIDAEARVARVVGGTLWQDVATAAAPYGLTALHGSSPDVAVAGYALGGGLSFYARQHGLAASSIRAVEVVTADGSLVRADAATEADLFWAVRGGGGNFGVVVAIELALLPIPDVVSGMLLWDAAHADAVTRAWARWTHDVPDSVTTSLRVMSFPPLPDLPPFLSGRQLVVIDGAVLESDERAAELLAPLRELAPEMDTFTRIPSVGVLGVHMDPPGPTPAVSDHAVLRDVTDETVTALLSAVGPGTGSSLLFAELRHLGGALSEPAEGGGAVSFLPGAYALFCVAIAPFPEAAAQGLADGAAVVSALAPWSMSARMLNFTEHVVDVSSGYDGEDWARLCAVRDRVDPDRVFLANHSLG